MSYYDKYIKYKKKYLALKGGAEKDATVDNGGERKSDRTGAAAAPAPEDERYQSAQLKHRRDISHLYDMINFETDEPYHFDLGKRMALYDLFFRLIFIHLILPRLIGYYYDDRSKESLKEKISGILYNLDIQGVGDEVIEEMLLELFRHPAFSSIKRDFYVNNWYVGDRSAYGVPVLDLDEYEKDVQNGNIKRTFFRKPPPIGDANWKKARNHVYSMDVPVETLVSAMKHILHSLLKGETTSYRFYKTKKKKKKIIKFGPSQRWFIYRFLEIYSPFARGKRVKRGKKVSNISSVEIKILPNVVDCRSFLIDNLVQMYSLFMPQPK